MKALVLDRNRHLVPVGFPGELYIGGAGVGIGYLNDPKKTQSSFIIDPFERDRSAQLYRTGDRVKNATGWRP